MASISSTPMWRPTGVQNLQRHANGTYYARVYLRGKETLKSLRTKTLSVAKMRLHELKGDALRSSPNAPSMDAMTTLRQAADLRRQAIKRLLRKPATIDFYLKCLAALERSWPDFDQQLRRVTKTDCEDWASYYVDEVGPNRFNNTVRQLQHVLELGVEAGIIVSNPAKGLSRQPVRPKELVLPSSAEFSQLISAIEDRNGRFSKDCSQMVQFLAYSGCRRNEGAMVTWADVDRQNGVMTVRGDEKWATKNGEIRRVPINPSLRNLLESIKEERGAEPGSYRVLKIQECYKALRRACETIGIPKLTHHDLRHLFATRCIESGVDIPTVARWLGHKDGGVLAMKVYGHLRQEHSIQQAQKVRF